MENLIYRYKGFFLIFVFLLAFSFAAENYSEPREVSRTEALDLLIRTEGFVLEMEAEGLTVYFEKDNLLDAKRYFIGKDISELEQFVAFEDDSKRKTYLQQLVLIGKETPSYELKNRDYYEAARLADIVIKRRTQAYEILDAITLFEEREEKERDSGVDTGDSLGVFGLVAEAFEAGRYDEVEEILDEANLKLDEAVNENQKINSAIRATQGFFVKYWWQIILFLAIFVAASFPVGKRVIRRLRERRLANLKTKLVLNRELLRSAQESCFNAKVITTETYRIREKKYKADRVKLENKVKILEKLLGVSKKGEYGDGRGKGLIVRP